MAGSVSKRAREETELEKYLRDDRERIARQRKLWEALPDLGPSGINVDALKIAMLDRAWELLDCGQIEAADAILEFLPEVDAESLLNEFFKDA